MTASTLLLVTIKYSQIMQEQPEIAVIGMFCSKQYRFEYIDVQRISSDQPIVWLSTFTH